MYVRQTEEQDGRGGGAKQGEGRENPIPDYMCLWCSVGGQVLKQVRERVKGKERERKQQRKNRYNVVST